METKGYIIIGGGLLIGALIAYKGMNASAAAVGAAAVGAVGGAATGAVIGIGSLFGVPETDATKCQAARTAGNALDASLYCPLADFFNYVTGQDNTGGATGGW